VQQQHRRGAPELDNEGPSDAALEAHLPAVEAEHPGSVPAQATRPSPPVGAMSAAAEIDTATLDEEIQSARAKEREILEAIYGTDFEVLGDSAWLVRFHEDITLHVYLPSDYPRAEAPTPMIEWRHGVVTPTIVEALLQQWTPGEGCVYQWAEHLRDALVDAEPLMERERSPPQCGNDEALAAALQADDVDAFEATAMDDACVYAPGVPRHHGRHRPELGAVSQDEVEIVHGEPLVDRKSTFQAHLALVTSMGQVDWARRQLLLDKRIASATHNILAYRFRDDARGIVVADNDDDGESSAGGKLAALLDLRGAMGVLVVVSRWYGGIQLGPDRFKNINRCAQLLLDSAGLTRQGGGGPQARASQKGK